MEEKKARDEEAANREKAAKKVIQEALAEQYRKEMEAKKKQKDQENEKTRQQDTLTVQQLIHETDPDTMRATMVIAM